MPPKKATAKREAEADAADMVSKPNAKRTKVTKDIKETTTAKATKPPAKNKAKSLPIATTPPSSDDCDDDDQGGAEDSEEDSETAGQPTPTPPAPTPAAVAVAAEKQKKRRSPIKTGSSTKAVNYVLLRDPLNGKTGLSMSSENQTTIAKTNPKTLDFELINKISSPLGFQFAGFVALTDGPHKDHSAILFKHSKPFNFLGLPIAVRRMILLLVLAPLGQKDGKIDIIPCKKTSTFKAKDYSEGLKNRVGILRVNKEIYAEARPILYDNMYRFTDTDVLLNFLTLTTSDVHRLMTYIQIITYKKKSAQTAMRVMADCIILTRIHIQHGVGVHSTPVAAAKTFFANAAHLARVFNSIKGPGHAWDVLRFSPGVANFSQKEGGEVREYSPGEYAEFQNKLRDLMNVYPYAPVSFWTCLCGSREPFHTCADVLSMWEEDERG